MADMTGFNPTQAQAEIDRLGEELYKSLETFIDSSVSFFGALGDAWYSPKAVEFFNYSSPVLVDLQLTYLKMADIIIKNSVAAYNVLAKANDCGTIESNASYCIIPEGAYTDVEAGIWDEGPNGEVGMNTLLVKASILPKFKESITKFLNGLDSLPLDIGFYDPAGELKARFKEMVVKFKEHATSKTNDIVVKIETLMTTEVENIEIAKNAAAETLSA